MVHFCDCLLNHPADQIKIFYGSFLCYGFLSSSSPQFYLSAAYLPDHPAYLLEIIQNQCCTGYHQHNSTTLLIIFSFRNLLLHIPATKPQKHKRCQRECFCKRSCCQNSKICIENQAVFSIIKTIQIFPLKALLSSVTRFTNAPKVLRFHIIRTEHPVDSSEQVPI